MWSFRRSNRRGSLERALRAARAEPREEFVRRLAGEVRAETPRRVEWSRLAFAGSLSVVILGTFAAFGGLGYAASGATSSYHVVKQVVVKHKVTVSVHKSSAAAQYPHQPSPPTQTPAGTNVEAAGVAKASGALPFTGFSLVGTFIVGIALLVVGLVLRRRERKAS